ncbi:hypothetical protein EVAR_59803_1 [Eumeta japonica]|uniref:Uncharacterized protein n=1 Tax=Eumeta variegata TaxID=151549 RepID=A0A4C1YG20_EUMVA|nr:hypothetical protein EVAR_59803_1 [Eumeta japonica]
MQNSRAPLPPRDEPMDSRVPLRFYCSVRKRDKSVFPRVKTAPRRGPSACAPRPPPPGAHQMQIYYRGHVRPASRAAITPQAAFLVGSPPVRAPLGVVGGFTGARGL